MTGSGFLLVSVSVHEQSVNHDQMNVLSHSGSLLVELRVPPPPPPSSLLPPLFRQCEAHGRLSALAVRKIAPGQPAKISLTQNLICSLQLTSLANLKGYRVASAKLFTTYLICKLLSFFTLGCFMSNTRSLHPVLMFRW